MATTQRRWFGAVGAAVVVLAIDQAGLPFLVGLLIAIAVGGLVRLAFLAADRLR